MAVRDGSVARSAQRTADPRSLRPGLFSGRRGPLRPGSRLGARWQSNIRGPLVTTLVGCNPHKPFSEMPVRRRLTSLVTTRKVIKSLHSVGTPALHGLGNRKNHLVLAKLGHLS